MAPSVHSAICMPDWGINSGYCGKRKQWCLSPKRPHCNAMTLLCPREALWELCESESDDPDRVFELVMKVLESFEEGPDEEVLRDHLLRAGKRVHVRSLGACAKPRGRWKAMQYRCSCWSSPCLQLQRGHPEPCPCCCPGCGSVRALHSPGWTSGPGASCNRC